VLALLAGGAMTLLTVSGCPHDRPLADDCGLVRCSAILPRSVTGAAAPGAAARSTAPARPQPTAQRRTIQPVLAPKAYPIRTQAPTASPSAQPPASPNPGHSHHHHRQGQH
jgi:hypothetical protein